MPKTRPPYDPEFRQRILELLHSGRTLKSLAEECGQDAVPLSSSASPLEPPLSPPQVFESLVSAPLSVVHHYVSELHTAGADATCALIAAHLGRPDGLRGLRTLHAGAGFGGDARVANLWGVEEALGVESGAAQVAFDEAFRTLDDDALGAQIRGDEAARGLYPAAALELTVQALLEERAHVRRLPWRSSARVVLGNVLSDDLVGVLGGRPADALIGNFMLHWLLVDGRTLGDVLDVLAPAVRPSGLAVFCVPYHLVQPKDRGEETAYRATTAYDTALYRALVPRLIGLVQAIAKTRVLPMESNKVAPIAVPEGDAERGSRHFEFVQLATRYFGARSDRLVDTLRGAAMYEATFRTGLSSAELAPLVRQAVDEAVAAVSPRERAPATGTYLRFFVFRRRP